MEDNMKILMTTDTVGGVWVYSLELCKALQKHGVQVHLVAMGQWPTEEQEQEAAKLSNVLLYKSDYKLEWMQDPWEDVEKARKWINCIYHTVLPDLVHLNNYAQVCGDWECPTISVFHSCVSTWWQAVKGTAVPSHWQQYVETVKSSLQCSDLVVSPSKAILEKAQATHGFTTESKVIYNGRDLSFPERGKKENIIFCIGRIWDEGKNLMLLSRVAKELPWPVFIAGNNTNPSTGKTLEIENVNFLGSLSETEVREWIHRASIFVSPTKYEPFGLAILEAAEAGCALALSNIETLQEIWGDSALFFNPQDREEAKAKIMELIENETQRETYSEKALLRSELYSTEKMGDAYFEMYKESIQKKTKTKAA